MTTAKIGFIGIGLMGSAMCNRLLDQGYSLTVMANRSRERIDALVARGATEVATPKELAQASDVVMLCMDTSQSVEGRIYGDDGVLAGVNKNAVVIDFGTSLPASTKKIGASMIEAGAVYLDAPIGRTPAHAKDGLLNLMCSGDEAAFKKVESVLKDLGENVFHLGALGTGHTIKLINNFMGQNIANSMAEAFVMADLAGVEREKVYDVMAAGPTRSGIMDFLKAYAVDNNPEMMAFSIRNAHKDVGYYVGMAQDLGVDSLMAKESLSALTAGIDQGRGDEYVPLQVETFKALLSKS